MYNTVRVYIFRKSFSDIIVSQSYKNGASNMCILERSRTTASTLYYRRYTHLLRDISTHHCNDILNT